MKSQGEGSRSAAGQARARSCSTRVTLLLPDARSYVTCHNSSQAFPYIRVVGRATASSHVCSLFLRSVLNMRVFLVRRLRALATSPTPPSAGLCRDGIAHHEPSYRLARARGIRGPRDRTAPDSASAHAVRHGTL